MSWFLAWAWVTMGVGPGVETNATEVFSADESCESTCQTHSKACTSECKSLKPGLKADCLEYCGRKAKTCTDACGVKSPDESFATRLL